MRKQLLIAALLLCLGGLQAQAQRRAVLIEEFTNTGCGPCASYAPTLDNFLYERLGDVAPIKTHTSWPNGHDPFYYYLQEECRARWSYYDVSGVPTVVINGQAYNQPSSATLNEAVDKFLASEEKLSIALSYTVDGDKLAFEATLTPRVDTTLASLRVRVCPVETEIVPAEVYPNGEKQAYYVMRGLYPNADGFNPGEMLSKGKTYVYKDTCDISNFTDKSQLAMVAYVQNDANKQVLASVYIPRAATQSDYLNLMRVTDTPDNICVPIYYGKVIFRNEGAQPVTSATLNVSVNGAVKTYEWTGNMAYMDKDTMSFDGFDRFELSNSTMANDVEFWFSNINGTENESNHKQLTFSNSVQAENKVQLKFYTDNKPQETTWKVLSSAGDVVAQGGPYTEARHFYTEDISLDQDDCYTLEFEDAGGDGITGDNGNGYYQLYQIDTAGKKKRLTQGDYAGAIYDVYFSLKNAATGIALPTTNASKNAKYYGIDGKQLSEKAQKGITIIKNGETTYKRIEN